MNKNYETVFVLNPVLSDKQVEDTVKIYETHLKKSKVKFICNEALGFKKTEHGVFFNKLRKKQKERVGRYQTLLSHFSQMQKIRFFYFPKRMCTRSEKLFNFVHS